MGCASFFKDGFQQVVCYLKRVVKPRNRGVDLVPDRAGEISAALCCSQGGDVAGNSGCFDFNGGVEPDFFSVQTLYENLCQFVSRAFRSSNQGVKRNPLLNARGM